MRAAFRWATRARYLDRDPLVGLRVEPLRVRDVVPPDTDLLRLIDAAPAPLAAALRALYLTGCRPGEVVGLTIDRVDLAGGTWQVRDKIRGKTGSEFRTVYLSPGAIDLTRSAVGDRATGHVFLKARGGPWTRKALTIYSGLVRRRIGLGPDATPHAFRHAFVTRKLVEGVPPATVAALVGHRSISTTMRVYSKLDKQADHLRQAVAKD